MAGFIVAKLECGFYVKPRRKAVIDSQEFSHLGFIARKNNSHVIPPLHALYEYIDSVSSVRIIHEVVCFVDEKDAALRIGKKLIHFGLSVALVTADKIAGLCID